MGRGAVGRDAEPDGKWQGAGKVLMAYSDGWENKEFYELFRLNAGLEFEKIAAQCPGLGYERIE